MTDVELAAKKLAFIETCVRELKDLARPELIATDLREERFVVHTLPDRHPGRPGPWPPISSRTIG